MNNNKVSTAPNGANETPDGVNGDVRVALDNMRRILMAAALMVPVSLSAGNTTPTVTQAPTTIQSGDTEDPLVGEYYRGGKGKKTTEQVSFGELSPEEQAKLLQVRDMAVDFLKKNAPKYANDKRVLAVTTAGVMEYEANGGTAEQFFKDLGVVVSGRLIIVPKVNNFCVKSPEFIKNIEDLKNLGLEIFDPLTLRVRTVVEYGKSKQELAETEEEARRARSNAEKWDMIGGLVDSLSSVNTDTKVKQDGKKHVPAKPSPVADTEKPYIEARGLPVVPVGNTKTN